MTYVEPDTRDRLTQLIESIAWNSFAMTGMAVTTMVPSMPAKKQDRHIVMNTITNLRGKGVRWKSSFCQIKVRAGKHDRSFYVQNGPKRDLPQIV